MSGQSISSQEITKATLGLDQQTRQANQAMREQTDNLKQITNSSANIGRQIKSIAAANVENSKSTTVILERIRETREIARQNKESISSLESNIGEGRSAGFIQTEQWQTKSTPGS